MVHLAYQELRQSADRPSSATRVRFTSSSGLEKDECRTWEGALLGGGLLTFQKAIERSQMMWMVGKVHGESDRIPVSIPICKRKQEVTQVTPTIQFGCGAKQLQKVTHVTRSILALEGKRKGVRKLRDTYAALMRPTYYN
ncbi:hypothetical protein ASPFODRAFT_55921 [Aspergillus luchuensis CBS 106.47]|uniref:Uncharacterized protein n=1 Tax=Aspergillus luchuensis (strain CBS 106.47) TaxID=1137211 RepID=A0A1M3TZX1_ASPLC|nr:hypothetical protein ASPFODRAFT_55921 [Aspergillus luchuensis CBS 106.47]